MQTYLCDTYNDFSTTKINSVWPNNIWCQGPWSILVQGMVCYWDKQHILSIKTLRWATHFNEINIWNSKVFIFEKMLLKMLCAKCLQPQCVKRHLWCHNTTAKTAALPSLPSRFQSEQRHSRQLSNDSLANCGAFSEWINDINGTQRHET